jgi:hypothetical protein
MTNTANETRAPAPATPPRPTHLIYRCARCGGTLTEAHPDVDVALRRAIETGDMLRVHGCPDLASGLAELVGTGPGQPFTSTTGAA